MPEIFSARRAKHEHDQEAFQAQLSQQIGQRKVEVDWRKKKLDLPPDAKRELMEPEHPQRSMTRQGDLIGLPRSTSDDQGQGERAEHRYVRHVLDQPYTDTPYYGVRRRTAWVRRQGSHVHHQRVARLRHTLGIEAISPKPRLSQAQPTHRVYPDVLRGGPIPRVNQVWSTDITDIRRHGGFLSLVAVLDWLSR
jgi:putative transposase